jgi:hypothetical protein
MMRRLEDGTLSRELCVEDRDGADQEYILCSDRAGTREEIIRFSGCETHGARIDFFAVEEEHLLIIWERALLQAAA